MRVVKLGKRFVLARRGYTHAFRFDSWSKEAHQIETILRELYPDSLWMNGDWATYYGKRDNYTLQRPYWIGVRKETDITRILLKL